MKQPLFTRLCALILTLCLCAAPAFSTAETWLPDGEVTHTDFTLSLGLHADAFPAGKAHLSDWEAYLKKLSLRGSMDSLAMFTPTSRVYMDAALQLNGEDRFPFVYDGYYSYRYLSPPRSTARAVLPDVQLSEFMLKPYYYMELPTQYLALMMYPDAAYWLGDSYYTPSGICSPRPVRTRRPRPQRRRKPPRRPRSGRRNGCRGGQRRRHRRRGRPTAIFLTGTDAEAGTFTYNVPYEDLYELCETLDLIVNDDYDLSRAYYFFTCLLTDLYASDMTLEILGNLEYELDALDPDQNGMTVTETADSLTCAIGTPWCSAE